MIYYKGDIHGNPEPIVRFAQEQHLTKKDTVVILGDAGLNYYCDWRDTQIKQWLDQADVTILSIHGNHEERPYNCPGYREIEWKGGIVYAEKEFPNLLFAKDGEVYDMDGHQAIAIGGAYSVDKYYRLEYGYRWFSSEQPDAQIKKRVGEKLDSLNWNVEMVLSHTCPQKYIPSEAFLPNIYQDTVNRSTEEWLDTIEDRLTYRLWFCGHWHIDKNLGRIRFIMDDFITIIYAADIVILY